MPNSGGSCQAFLYAKKAICMPILFSDLIVAKVVAFYLMPDTRAGNSQKAGRLRLISICFAKRLDETFFFDILET